MCHGHDSAQAMNTEKTTELISYSVLLMSSWYSLSQGKGIKLLQRGEKLSKKRIIVQKYVSNPYLIGGYKFDMRLYVYVPSIDPLRIYLYPDARVRFATEKYSTEDLGNVFIHLTNGELNKKNINYTHNSKQNLDSEMGHTWNLRVLRRRLKAKGIDMRPIWKEIQDLIVKQIISGETTLFNMMAHQKTRYCCHELFGYDVMLDDKVKPWLLEVTRTPSQPDDPVHASISGPMLRDVFNLAGYRLPKKSSFLPSLSTRESQPDDPVHTSISGPMLRDVFNLAGYRLPKKSSFLPSLSTRESQPDDPVHASISGPMLRDVFNLAGYSLPKKSPLLPSLSTRESNYSTSRGEFHAHPKTLRDCSLAACEIEKRSYFTRSVSENEVTEHILDDLTPADVRELIDAEDEYNRRGEFQRIFPSPTSHKYLKYFEEKRYSNLLLDAWTRKHHSNREHGWKTLDAACKKNLDLQSISYHSGTKST